MSLENEPHSPYEPERHPTPPAHAPAPLDYEVRRDAAPEVSVPVVIATAIGSTLLVVFSSFVPGLWIGGLAIMIVVLVVAAITLRANPARRSYSIGIWIGLGVGVLIQGVCWVAVIGSLGR